MLLLFTAASVASDRWCFYHFTNHRRLSASVDGLESTHSALPLNKTSLTSAVGAIALEFFPDPFPAIYDVIRLSSETFLILTEISDSPWICRCSWLTVAANELRCKLCAVTGSTFACKVFHSIREIQTVGSRACPVAGPQTWNDLPEDVTEQLTVSGGPTSSSTT